MTEIIGVRFKSGGKEYYFDPRGTRVAPGEEVIIETAKGLEFGVCSQANTQVEDDSVVQPLRPLIRLATDRDREVLRRNREKEKSALEICEAKVLEHKLDMKLVRCECSFDGNKLLFFFTSEGRVDFRALVKDLASTFHSRIELRQIGVRDESKMVGGLGICGRPFCCNAFLEQFQPVSIKMAKTQGLSLNPAKISGACGRLMCCLKYEQDAYEDAVKRMPKNESFVETPDGAGTISSVDYLRETVKVRLEDTPDAPQSYAATELNVIRSGKGRRPEGYVAPPREQLERLRRVTPPPAAPEEFSLSGSIDAALSALGGGEPRKGGQGRNAGRRRSDKPRQEGQSKADGKPSQENKPKQENRPKQDGRPRQENRPGPKPQSKEGVRPGKSPEGQSETPGRNRRRRRRGGGKPKEGGAPAGTQE